jgi:spore germination protein KC
VKKKWLITLTLLITLIPLTGCWDRNELNELGIVVGLGIDKVGKQYESTIQLVNTGEVATQKGGSGRAAASVYHERGDTLFEIHRRMSTQSPRKLYFSHLQILVIGEKVAKEGIEKVLDLLSRNYQVRTDFYVVVAKRVKASDVLDILTPVEKIPAQNLFSKLETSDKQWAATGVVKLDELINDLTAKGKDAVLTGIEVTGNKKAGMDRKNVESIDSLAKLKYYGMAAFKWDKMVGWLNENESKGVNYLLPSHVKSTLINIPCTKGSKIGIELIRSNIKMKGSFENGKPVIDVNIRAEGNVGEVQCKIDITKPKTIQLLEKKTEKSITHEIDEAVKKSKKLQADILGFGEALHRANPKAWKKIEKTWREKELQETEVRTHVDLKIRRVGTVTNSFIKEME